MKDYIGLVVAVENYHNSQTLSQVSFALNDATGFIDSLVKLGCEKEKIEFLPDNLATKTTITEKIREIARNAQPNETIIFYFAGHGFLHNGKNLITCVDTSSTALLNTTIDINKLLGELDKSKSNKVIAFLDCCHSGLEFSAHERSPISDFATDALKYEYKDAEHLIVFASCKSNEKSHADLERKHGVWSYYLIQALTGEAKGIYDDAVLFSDKLQKYLADRTYERVKKITTEKKNQTPVKFGKESLDKFIVADLSKIFLEKEIKASSDGIRFERATIINSEEDLVKNLPGFELNHKVPKQIDSYHEGWIKKIASDLIVSELNDVARTLKARLKYKRKDIEEPVIEDGVGQLNTADFDYVVSIAQSSEKADRYVLTRSIENFKNSDILNNTEFNEIFSDTFDELELRLKKRLDVAAVIDKIEEIDNDELISVDYDHTNTSICIVKIKGLNGHIELTETTLSLKMKKKHSPKNLVLSCQNAYESIGQHGVQKMLGTA
jgi:hypothetical protein